MNLQKKLKDLTKKQKKIVETTWKYMLEDKTFECRKKCKTLKTFWENHKEMDFPKML